MHQQFMAAVRQLANEKKLSEDMVIDIVKSAITTAYKKDYGNKEQNIDVEVDPKTEMVTVYIVKTVVDEVLDDDGEISLPEAKKLNKTIKMGDTVRMDVTPLSYGRIAAQAAKQVIIQRINEAERDVMYEMFKDRENELINAMVQRVDNQFIYVDLGGGIAMLPGREQIPTEQYYGGQRIKLYLDRVVKTPKGPQLLISRTHPKLVEKLMELEIPEIKSGTVQVKGVAREPGVRCKVAVFSTDAQVDPVGACVGQRGARVQAITQELSGERIDVIPWSENAADYIREALKPAKIVGVELNEETHVAKVYVLENQRALAIGSSGQNVRLASRLTGWEIDIENATESQTMPAGSGGTAKDEHTLISELKLDKKLQKKLESAHLTQIEQLKGLSFKDLMQVEGVNEDEAKLIVAAVKKVK